ncbi:MAG: leucyl aminopeptidase family protein [Alphaproteobacteria bacterium]|nr:leucyl aminopeptidase family protein [Alphaproteobacteria bacterium]
MADILLTRAPKNATPLLLLTEKAFGAWAKKKPKRIGQWMATHEFAAKPGTFWLVPDAEGKVERVVAGISETPSLWDIADFSTRLPAGSYALESDAHLAYQEWLALGWVLGAHKFTRYKKAAAPKAKLVLPPGADAKKIARYAASICLARDLITTPAEDMGPEQLADAAVAMAKKYGAKISQIVGDDLLKKNFPAIHRVGRASYRAPRLVDLTWGNPKHPKITLVGKGVCFDTGGLDIKPSSGMYLMKKDMGGAACVLAIAQMVMDAKLPVRLRVLIPAVENAVAGNAYRPSDVITMRNGLTVEVGNTDAEGRLILADALAEASAEKPELMIDFATLTGAARGALGTELPALFCNNDAVADQMLAAGKDMEDPLWRMPLHKPYAKMLDSAIADLNSAPGSPYAGAITAALFLQRFVGDGLAWAHIDLMAYNLAAKPGRPEGGEAQAVRAVYRLIEQRAGIR